MIAAIYARKSTEQAGVADDAKSVARQIENAKAFAAEKGWLVGDIYSDDAVSGADVGRLRNRQRLLQAIEAGPPFQVLIMREQARFSRRDGDEALAELKRIVQAGVELWFYQDGRRFEYGTFGHNVIGFVEAEMNAEYRRQIARWTADAMKRKALAGHVTGGKTFGYDNVNIPGPGGKRSHVEQTINEAQAAVIRRIFELRADGQGYTAIARLLNDEHALAPGAQRGRPAGWASSSVREALHRTKYRGLITYGATKKRTPDGRVKAQARPQQEHTLIDAAALRIVSDELWQAAHARLATDRARYTGKPKGRPPAARGKYLLTGMARCGECGGGIEAQTRNHGTKHRATFYVCATAQRKGAAVCKNKLAIRAESVDDALTGLMETAVLSEAVREQAISEATTRLTRRDDEAEGIDRELRDLHRRGERLAEQIENGNGDSAFLVGRLRKIEDDISQRNARLKALAAAAPTDPNRVRAALTSLFDDWRALLRSEPEAGRRVLQTLIHERLRFTPGTDDEGEFYTITGLAAVPELIGEKTLVNVASPSGGVTRGNPVHPNVCGIERACAA